MTQLHMARSRALPCLAAAALIASACGKAESPPPATNTAPPVATAGASPPVDGPAGMGEAPVPSDPRDPVAVALPTDELELGEEPDDAPHVDAALRIAAPREGDRVIGRGFVIDGVPDDVTVYWPRGDDGENVYVVYDGGLDHVATLVEAPVAAPGPPRFDPAEVRWESGRRFEVWPSDFAAGQKKRGPGRTAAFTGPRFRYRVDAIAALPWLTAGFRYRVDPPPGT